MHTILRSRRALHKATSFCLVHLFLFCLTAGQIGCSSDETESETSDGFHIEEPWLIDDVKGRDAGELDLGVDQDSEDMPAPVVTHDMRPAADASPTQPIPVEACLRVSPGSALVEADQEDQDHYTLSLDSVEVGNSHSSTFLIENCSFLDPLHIESIEWLDDGGGAFRLIDPSEGESIELPPVGERTITIEYRPESHALDHGELLVTLAGEERQITIDVEGMGVQGYCPLAVAEATILNAPGRPSTEISTIPLTTVQLHGHNSRDPDGSVQRYEWNIISAPIDSGTRLQPSNRVENPRLFIDVAGEYEVELVVYDALGQPSCTSSIVTILAKPDEDIHVQLSWDTPSDGDQTDSTGADLDLHYMRITPTSRWNNATYDVYWENPEGDWGIVGDPSDNPSLDIDDTDGKGPENINHDHPETGSFAVGVHYYDDNDHGASYATVRIYIESQLKFEERDKHLPNEDIFWDVASITWPSRRIYIRDRTSQGFPIEGSP